MGQADHPVRGSGHLQIMGDHDDSQAFFGVQGAQQAGNVCSGIFIKVPSGFIGQKHSGIVDERPGNGGPLHFTPRKLARAVVEAMSQTYSFE
jgi:hypothetical protein